MTSAWKLLTSGLIVCIALLGCRSMEFGWRTRTSDPIPARPLREAQPAEQAVAEASTSQPAAESDDAGLQTVDPDVAPLDAQIQAFTGRVAAADEARSTVVESAAPVVAPPVEPPASQPAPSHQIQPQVVPEHLPPPVRGASRPPVAKVYGPAIFGPERPQPPVPPIVDTTAEETAIATPSHETASALSPVAATLAPATSVPPPMSATRSPAAAPANPLNVEIVEVRPAAMSPPVSDSTALASPANQPAEPDAALNGVQLKTIVERLERDMERRPPHPDDQIRLRLLYLAAGLPQKATGPIDGMDPVQGELLSAVLQTVASTRQAILEPTEANPTALTAAEELRRLLGQQAGVIIPRVCLVTRVSSFGDYEAITPLRFKAGQPIQAYVYTEVANYRSEPTEDGRLRTLLSEKIEVFSSDGKLVWQRAESNIEDRVRTPRHDFFIPFPIRLPATLPAGEYVLKATIEDRIGGTTDQQRLTFSIHD